jgi:hypothetical protein
MRKKQPSKQAYARHEVGQSGSSMELNEPRGELSGMGVVAVGALERAMLPTLPLRLSLSKERAIVRFGVLIEPFARAHG